MVLASSSTFFEKTVFASKMFMTTLLFLVVVTTTAITTLATTAVPLPTSVQQQWMDFEIGGLVTWGMNRACSSTPGICKSGSSYRQTTGVKMCSGCNWALNSLPTVSAFNPVDLNIESWVLAASSFGAKYLVLAANHGGGFALWPTKVQVPRHGTYNYSVGSSQESWTKNHDVDIVRTFVDTCRKHGIRPGVYLNIGQNMYLNFGATSNSHSIHPYQPFQACSMNPAYGPLLPGQVNLTKPEILAVELAMMEELFTNYGNLTEIWFDGGVPEEIAPELAKLIDLHQQSAVAFQGPERRSAGFSGNIVRWSGTETGHTPSTDMWSTIVAAGTNFSQPMEYGKGDAPNSTVPLEFVPSEQDGSIQPYSQEEGGFWYPTNNVPKQLDELMDEYEDSVGHNSNYLLELSPNPNGTLSTEEIERYEEFGKKLNSCYVGSRAKKSEAKDLPKNGMKFVLPGTKVGGGGVDRIFLREDVDVCGQRANGFALHRSSDGELIGNGSSIGHGRIVVLEEILEEGEEVMLELLSWVGETDEGKCGGGRMLEFASFSRSSC